MFREPGEISLERDLKCFAVYGWTEAIDLSKVPQSVGAITRVVGMSLSSAYGSRAERDWYSNPTRVAERMAESQLDAATFFCPVAREPDPSAWQACYSINLRPAELTFVAADSEATLSEFADQCMHALAPWGAPFYGFAYLRSSAFGPLHFALGVNYCPRLGAIDKAEGDRTTNWLMDITSGSGPAPLVHRQGYLRDVFPVNFLSREHLEQPVDAQNLKDWIVGHSDRGYLQELAPGSHRWIVPDSAIPSIRATLHRNGVLLHSHMRRRRQLQ